LSSLSGASAPANTLAATGAVQRVSALNSHPPPSPRVPTLSHNSDARVARAIIPCWGKALFREAKALLALERTDEAVERLTAAVQLPMSRHFADRDREQLRKLLVNAVVAPPPRALPSAPVPERVNETRLLRLAKDNMAAELQVLIDHGASPDSCNRVGQTALHIAAIWNSLDALRCLIGAGANVNVQNTLRGSTPLHSAAQRGSVGAAKVLLESGANPMIADQTGQCPFETCDNDELRELLGGPSTAAHKLAAQQRVAELTAMVESDASRARNTDSGGDTPLLALMKSAGATTDFAALLRCADTLVENGCDVNAANFMGGTALHYAVEAATDLDDAQSCALVKALIARGAGLERKNRSGSSFAARGFMSRDMQSSDPNALVPIDDAHHTPLLIAAELGLEAVLATLLSEGADVNAHDEMGATALHYAMEEDELDMMRILLNEDADVSIGSKDWGAANNALCWAADRGACVQAINNTSKQASLKALPRNPPCLLDGTHLLTLQLASLPPSLSAQARRHK